MAFVPYTKTFAGCPPGSGTIVHAKATQILPRKVVLDHGEPIPYEYLVMATGTKLPPPGNVPVGVEGKVDGIKYFEKHESNVDKAQNIVVIGGGAVGVRTLLATFYISSQP